MEVSVDKRNAARVGLPERYAPLVEYVSSNQVGLNAAFETACQRIESRRLLAEHDLRRFIQAQKVGFNLTASQLSRSRVMRFKSPRTRPAAPSFAKRSAAARPMPLAAPVMTAIFPLISN